MKHFAQLKSYAERARRAFITAVTERAAEYGLTAHGAAPLTQRGDTVFIGGAHFPIRVARLREQLKARIERHGFAQFKEEMAYTWFNRFVAIRYMELHGHLRHGLRVLSHPNGASEPEILKRATEVALPGLDRTQVIRLKLDGSQDEALYRLLIVAQCNALSQAMPLLFDPIGSATELLIPRNLLHTQSPMKQLVNEVPEDAWEDIEIVGWLYQFYNAERKKEVIGKTVAAEDIPAATQLFTPDWIVQYLVQNSLGALWIGADRRSALLKQMPFHERTVDPTQNTGLPPPYLSYTYIRPGSSHDSRPCLRLRAYPAGGVRPPARHLSGTRLQAPRLGAVHPRKEPVRPGCRSTGYATCQLCPSDEGTGR